MGPLEGNEDREMRSKFVAQILNWTSGLTWECCAFCQNSLCGSLVWLRFEGNCSLDIFSTDFREACECSNTEWPSDWLIDWLIGLSVDQLIDWLIEWFIDWLIGWLIDRLIDWLFDWLIDWLIYCSFLYGIFGWKFFYACFKKTGFTVNSVFICCRACLQCHYRLVKVSIVYIVDLPDNRQRTVELIFALPTWHRWMLIRLFLDTAAAIYGVGVHENGTIRFCFVTWRVEIVRHCGSRSFSRVAEIK